MNKSNILVGKIVNTYYITDEINQLYMVNFTIDIDSFDGILLHIPIDNYFFQKDDDFQLYIKDHIIQYIYLPKKDLLYIHPDKKSINYYGMILFKIFFYFMFIVMIFLLCYFFKNMKIFDIFGLLFAITVMIMMVNFIHHETSLSKKLKDFSPFTPMIGEDGIVSNYIYHLGKSIPKAPNIN